MCSSDLSSVHVSADVIPICASYLRLLHRWNQRMNLTALPLGEVPPDASIQKLVVEPLCGAALAEGFTGDWLDLGSGGGSPALPLRSVLTGARTLSMVESRGRKCAFLREAARQLQFTGVSVLDCRFEAMPQVQADLVTFRAVRVDAAFVDVVLAHLRVHGAVLAFGTTIEHPSLEQAGSRQLPDGSSVFRLVRIS